MKKQQNFIHPYRRIILFSYKSVHASSKPYCIFSSKLHFILYNWTVPKSPTKILYLFLSHMFCVLLSGIKVIWVTLSSQVSITWCVTTWGQWQWDLSLLPWCNSSGPFLQPSSIRSKVTRMQSANVSSGAVNAACIALRRSSSICHVMPTLKQVYKRNVTLINVKLHRLCGSLSYVQVKQHHNN